MNQHNHYKHLINYLFKLLLKKNYRIFISHRSEKNIQIEFLPNQRYARI